MTVTNTQTQTGNKTMATTQQRIAAVKADAQILRYCGFKARADYQTMQVVIRTPMTLSEQRQLQETVSPHTSIHVPYGYSTGN
jgi:hypothetical protein